MMINLKYLNRKEVKKISSKDKKQIGLDLTDNKPDYQKSRLDVIADDYFNGLSMQEELKDIEENEELLNSEKKLHSAIKNNDNEQIAAVLIEIEFIVEKLAFKRGFKEGLKAKKEILE